jgi:hypothetical protein
MKQIKLHFPNADYLTRLLADENFEARIFNLSPNRTNQNNLVLLENEEYHNNIVTEEAILSTFAEAFNRIIFTGTGNNTAYINPFKDQSKLGLVNNGEILIDDIEIINI